MDYYELLDTRFQALSNFEKLVVVLGLGKALNLSQRFSGQNFYIPKKPSARLNPMLSNLEQQKLIEAFGAGERIYIKEFSTITKNITVGAIIKEIEAGVKYAKIAQKFGVSLKTTQRIARMIKHD